MQSFAFTIADPEDAARFEAEISRDLKDLHPR